MKLYMHEETRQAVERFQSALDMLAAHATSDADSSRRIALATTWQLLGEELGDIANDVDRGRIAADDLEAVFAAWHGTGREVAADLGVDLPGEPFGEPGRQPGDAARDDDRQLRHSVESTATAATPDAYDDADRVHNRATVDTWDDVRRTEREQVPAAESGTADKPPDTVAANADKAPTSEASDPDMRIGSDTHRDAANADAAEDGPSGRRAAGPDEYEVDVDAPHDERLHGRRTDPVVAEVGEGSGTAEGPRTGRLREDPATGAPQRGHMSDAAAVGESDQLDRAAEAVTDARDALARAEAALTALKDQRQRDTDTAASQARDEELARWHADDQAAARVNDEQAKDSAPTLAPSEYGD